MLFRLGAELHLRLLAALCNDITEGAILKAEIAQRAEQALELAAERAKQLAEVLALGFKEQGLKAFRPYVNASLNGMSPVRCGEGCLAFTALAQHLECRGVPATGCILGSCQGPAGCTGPAQSRGHHRNAQCATLERCCCACLL